MNVKKFINYNLKFYHGCECEEVIWDENEDLIAYIVLVNHFVKVRVKVGYLVTADGSFIPQSIEDLEYSSAVII